MTTTDLAQLADAWIRYWQLPNNSAERKALSWAREREWDWVREEPNSAWFLILEILKRDSSSQILQVLSAGPLEDLLAQQGAQIIDRVEAEARSNPAFATLLGGVWRNSMSQEIWDRVQASWDRRGWDGNEA